MLTTVRHSATGPAPHPPLLIVHGLFGSARNWGAIARSMASDRDVHAVDMRNHGDSFRADAHGYPEMAADLAEVIGAQGPMDVMGHSMGGKAAMMLALTRPALVRRLLVADIAPVAYSHDQSAHIARMQSLDLTGLASRTEADARLAAIEPDAALRAFFLQSLDVRADPPVWRLNLPVLAAEMDRIVGWPEASGRFDGPALFLSGGASPYVRDEHREAILTQFPNATFHALPGAGHWLHAEQPRAFEAAMRAFLDA